MILKKFELWENIGECTLNNTISSGSRFAYKCMENCIFITLKRIEY